MKKGIHPNYRPVVFCDTSCGHKFLTRSTVATKETIEYGDYGKVALFKVEISSESHPFFTGKRNNISNISNVEKFCKKYLNSNQKIKSKYGIT